MTATTNTTATQVPGISTTPWTIDNGHSIAEFAVKHMMVSTVKGRFTALEGTLTFDPANPAVGSVRATIDVASINTADEGRDAHLRSDDFFHTELYPTATFASKRVEVVGDGEYRVHGDLTIRDVTREVVLDTEFEGRANDPWGNERIGFTGQTTINRKDFGLKWNALLESGGAVVGDKVKLTLHIEAMRPTSA